VTDPIVWVWALSAIGAALFFCTGMLVARLARASLPGGRAAIAVGDGRGQLDPDATIDIDHDLGTEAMERTADVPTAALQTDLLDRVLFAEADTRATRMELEEQVRLRRRSEKVRERLAGELAAEKVGRAEAARAAETARVRAAELERRLLLPEDGSATPPSVKLIADLHHDLSIAAPPPASPAGALQALVEDLTRRRRVKAAVVADELGLVVASSGAHGDELAAAGVMIAHAGARAQKLLAAGSVRSVCVEDDGDLRITVWPLGAVEGELALVTLATSGTAATATATADKEKQP
jgi:predicted regulator of Ras-like GTPase activity (Roadblock/LC7/MglB family)